LRPYAAEGSERVRISGPEIRIEPRCAMMLSPALHELATNAAKYGALSSAAGRLSVIWEPIRSRWQDAQAHVERGGRTACTGAAASRLRFASDRGSIPTAIPGPRLARL